MNIKVIRSYIASCEFNPLERKIDFSENWLIFLGIWGEAELILRILGEKEKYFQGAEEISFMDMGRSMHYFQGSREHRPPWWASNIFVIYTAIRNKS